MSENINKEIIEERAQNESAASADGAAAQEVSSAETDRRTAILRGWLPVLFWTALIPLVLSVLVSLFPALDTAAQLLNGVCLAANIVVLFRLSSTDAHYRYAAICSTLIIAADGLMAAVNLIPNIVFVSFVGGINVFSAIMSLIAEFNELTGHSEVLRGVDDKLSESWKTLWKWHLGLFIPTALGTLLVRFIPLVGTIITAITSIGVVIVGIVKLVYLCKTARRFKAQ